MITTIIFDVGGVFIKGTSMDFFRKACKLLEIDIEKIIVKKSIWDDMQRGKISLQNAMSKFFGIPVSDKRMKMLLDLWEENFELDFDVLNFAKKLKLKYGVGILSNVDKQSIEMYGHLDHHFDCFDFKFRSWQLGMMKPEKRIYEYALKELDVKPNECVFIDDKPVNVESAEKVGIHGVIFKNLEQLKQDLEKLGVMVE